MRVVHHSETTVTTTPVTVTELGLVGQDSVYANRGQISVTDDAHYTYSGDAPTTNSHKLTDSMTLFLESEEEVRNFKIRAASGSVVVAATFWRE